MSHKRPSRHLTKRERKQFRNSPAAKAARARKLALPFHRAAAAVRQIVDAGELPPGCAQVAEVMARCHEQHGAGVRDRPLLIGYGTHGDRDREAARARSTAEPPVFVGLSNETGLSRRWVIVCVALLAATGLYRRWWGGPHLDPRRNGQEVLQRSTVIGRCPEGKPIYGERREHVHGIGGSGMANAYTVEGIPDPLPDNDPPPPEPEPEPRWEAPRPEAVAKVREITENLGRDGVERQRRRLREQEERRRRQEEARGP